MPTLLNDGVDQLKFFYWFPLSRHVHSRKLKDRRNIYRDEYNWFEHRILPSRSSPGSVQSLGSTTVHDEDFQVNPDKFVEPCTAV